MGDCMKSARVLVLTAMAAIAFQFLSVKIAGNTLAPSDPIGGTFSYAIAEDTMADQYYSSVFGPIPLSGTPVDSMSIPFTGSYSSGTPVLLPAWPLLKLKWVYHVELMDTVQFLTVNVANNSSANFSRVIIILGSFGADTINNLLAHSSAAAQYNVRAQVIDSVINVTVSFMPSNTGTFTAGVDNLSASMSLNGLYAAKVVVLDSMFAGYQRKITNECNITDTVNADYMDIDKGFFVYSATNFTGLELQLSIAHRNLWRTDFCKVRIPALNSVSDLVGLTNADTNVAYGGEVTPYNARVDFPAGTVNKFSKTNISGCRMFPEWNPVTKKSVTKVDYRVNVGIYGRRVTLSAGDSLLFVIKTSAFKYTDMSGTLMETFKRSSDSLKFAMPASWTVGSSPDKFFCDFFTAVTMPQNAVVDTLVVSQNIFSAKNPDSNCQWTAPVIPAISGAFVREQADIARIIKLKPDTMCILVTSNTIPAGTHVVLVNDLLNPLDSSYNKYMGRMIIRDSISFAPSTGVRNGHPAPQAFAFTGTFPVLRYALPEQCRVSAACYDLRGRLVYSYVNKNQGPGSHALSIPAASWPHGAYCMVFKAGNFIRMGKVVVVR